MKSQKNKKNKQVETKVGHRPFLIRKCIFFPSFAAGALTSVFLLSATYGLIVYFLLTAFLDVIAQYVLKLKASDFSDPKQLLEHERISPQSLDRYYVSRSHIRVLSLAVAGLCQFLILSPVLFCSVYVGMTLISIVIAKFVLKIKAPVMIRRDDRALLLYSHGSPTSIQKTLDDMANGQLGIGIYGRWGRW